MNGRPGRWILLSLFAAALVVTSCGDETGPPVPVQVDLAFAPTFESQAVGIIPIGEGIFELRLGSGLAGDGTSQVVSVDTVTFAPNADTVEIELTVTVTDPDVQYLVDASLYSTAGNLVWCAVSELFGVGGSALTIVPLTFTYCGLGANADSVRIVQNPVPILAGDTLVFTADAYGQGAVIPGVPIVWSTPDPNIATVPDPLMGLMIGGPQGGSARIVALLLSGPADTVVVPVQLPPAGLVVDTGNNQTASVDSTLAQPIVARVTASDGSGVAGVWVRFVVTSGGGSVSLDSVLTDANGRASVTWTLGPTVGAQMVDATSAALPGITATFTATAMGGSGGISIAAGNGQTAPVDSAVAIAPAVTVTGPGGGPLVGATVVFSVTGGGGSITGSNATTDTLGVATLGSWTLGQTAGTNTLDATEATAGSVTFTATGAAQPATNLVVAGGDAQTADNGMPLANPVVVEAQDQFGNPVSAIGVSWFPTDGSVNPTSGVTNAQGQAQTTWTLGSNLISPTLTAQSAGLQSAVFTATTTFPNPSILQSLVGANRIRVGDSATMQVTLTAPAPVNGVTVAIVSDAPAVIQVGLPGSVFIAQGNTTGTITILAISSGTTTVRGTATGYTAGALSVLGSIQVLSVPVTLNVPFGGTASLPITLSTAAPAGGEIVNLSTTVPGNVGLVNSTVTVPAGQTTVNATVQGVLPGSSVVTATSVNYGSSQTTVSTTANLNIVQTFLAFSAGFPRTVTVRLESAGSQIAAPNPGIPVTMTARDPACVSPQSPVTIPTGLVDTVSTMSYGGTAQFGCSTWVVASATGIAADSVNVTVNPPPQVTLFTSTDVGSGLVATNSGNISQAAPAITTVRLVSLDSTIALLAPNSATPGAGTLDITVPQNQSSFSFRVYGLEGQTGAVNIVATSPGYVPDTSAVTVRQPALDIIFLSTSTTSLSNSDDFQVRLGTPNAQLTGMQREQALRPGGPAFVATLVTSVPATAQLVTAAVTGGTVTVGVLPNFARSPASVASGGVALDPLNAGTTVVSATAPGYAVLPTATATVTVSAPLMTLNATTRTGAGLQRAQGGSLGAPAPAGTVVQLVSADSSGLLLSPNTTTPGTGTLNIPIGTGAQSFTYYTNGIEGRVDTIAIYGSAPPYTPDTTTNAIWQPAVDVIFLNPTTTSLTVPDNFQLRIGVPNAQRTVVQFEQILRPGAPGLTGMVANSNAVVAELQTTASTGQTVTVNVNALNARSPSSVSAGGVALDPLAAGVTLVSATIPGYLVLPTATRTVTVAAPSLVLSSTVDVGSGLIRAQFLSLSAQVPDTTIITLVSADSSVLLLSPNTATPGTGTLVDTLFQGQNSLGYQTHGLEGMTGTVNIVATSPGYVPDTVTATVRQSAIDVIFLNPNITTLTVNDPFQARIGVPNAQLTAMQIEEALRPGGPAVTVTATNSQSGVAQLVTTQLSGQSVTTAIVLGTARTPTTLANAGMEFEPLATGSTTVQVTAPGFVTLPTASQVVNVTSPAITLSAILDGGSGLMRSDNGSLAAPAPAGTVVRIRSSNPSVVRVSANQTTVGTDSIIIPLSTGAQSFSYWIHGLEGQTGTVTITATAAGYTDGTTPVTIVQPAVDIIFLNTATTTLTAEDPFQVRVGVPNATNTGIQSEEVVRFGATPPTFTVTNSDPAVAELVTLPDTLQSVVVTVLAGDARSGSQVANGGVALQPLGLGTTNVAATGTGFISLPTATVPVTVSTPKITVNTVDDVGAGLQEGHSIFLGAGAPAGLIVRITSSDPSRVLVAPNASTAATAFIDFPVNTGVTSITYYTAGVEGVTGSADISATAPGYAGDTTATNVVQPAIDIVTLGTAKTVSAVDDAFYVRLGTPNAGLTGLLRTQELRAGAATLTVTVTNSNAVAGQLVTTAVTGQSVTVGVPEQLQNSPTNVTAGGVAFDALAVGTTTVSASASGYVTVSTSSVTIIISP